MSFPYICEVEIPADVIKACRKNDRKAQFELHRLSYGMLMGICLRYERNREDAESLLNMGFLKIFTNMDKYQDNVPFEAWARRIMINTIIDNFRKNKKYIERIEVREESDLDFNNRVSFNEADLQFDAEVLENMIRELPAISQKVFNMHVIDGFSHKDVAEMLGMSVGTSKWHVSNARKILKKKIVQQKELADKTLVL